MKYPNKINTEFGVAIINSKGYYSISSSKEGNRFKLLHRLIYEKENGEIPSNCHIHHIDNNPLNNSIDNLQCVTIKEHNIIHHKGMKHTNETKQLMKNNNTRYWLGKSKKPFSKQHKLNMSNAHKGKNLSKKHKISISKSKNKYGFYNVSQQKNEQYKQGFRWRYNYYEDDKRKYISSTDLFKLKDKVISKNLPWKILDHKKAQNTIEKYCKIS